MPRGMMPWGPPYSPEVSMPILAVALIFWIAAGCLGAGYLANAYRDNVDSAEMLAAFINAEKARLDVVEGVAGVAKDQARLANKLAETTTRALTDHLEQVYAWRAAKEKAALQPSKPRRRHNP